MQELSRNLGYIVRDVVDDFKYDILKLPQPQFSEINIPSHLDLKLKEEEDGVWVEALQLPDFYAVADSVEELPLAIHQSLLLYCGVPRYHARRQPKDGYITLPDGTRIDLGESLKPALKYV